MTESSAFYKTKLSLRMGLGHGTGPQVQGVPLCLNRLGAGRSAGDAHVIGRAKHLSTHATGRPPRPDRLLRVEVVGFALGGAKLTRAP